MIDTTFTEFRNQAKRFFDLVQMGETVRVSRNGRPIADIGPVPVAETLSWKARKATPLRVAGAEIARLILKDRGPVATSVRPKARRAASVKGR